MTLRPNYERAIRGLLRSAPYLDLEDMRRELTRHIELNLATYDRTISAVRRRKLTEFISGEGHILPDAYGLPRVMENILYTKAPTPDDAVGRAYGELYHYFFVPGPYIP